MTEEELVAIEARAKRHGFSIRPLITALQEAWKERERLSGVIERDRTKTAESIAALRGIVAGRSWLGEGRGNLAWDDDRYQEEFRGMIDELIAALDPLKVLAADWSDCPKDFQAARIDWKVRAEAAEAERDTALADLALSRFENGQMQKALVDVCAERDAAIARAEAAEEAYKEALGEERVANSRADMNARFRLAAEAERDAALAAGVREEREACAKIANLYGHVGVADERISDYDQGARDTADCIASVIRARETGGSDR